MSIVQIIPIHTPHPKSSYLLTDLEYTNSLPTPISAGAPNTDFIIYNIPQLAGSALTPGLYDEMRKNKNVIGVKNSSMPVQDIQIFNEAGGDDHLVFNGPDEQFISGRLIGAIGGIGGTYGAMPELFLKMNALLKEKDLDTARELQYAVNDIINLLTGPLSIK